MLPLRGGGFWLKRLFVQPIDKAGLADFAQYGVVDEAFGFRRFSLGMGRKIEHGLHRRSGNERKFFPCREESLIGIFEVRAVAGLGVFADDLLRVFAVGPGDFNPFKISL